MLIDLRSDTVTRPTKGMLDAMMSAKVGDDVFSEDPDINDLQEKIAKFFSMEAALFCPSGTMTNQIAIKVHTQPGNEVICDRNAHIYNYEGGGIGFHSGCSARLIHGARGKFTPQDVLDNINPPNDHYPLTSLVSVENTSNRGGGSFYTLEEMKAIGKVCTEKKLKYHLDGARIFNCLIETGNKPQELGKIFDSISVCFSKGLGCPVGSVVMGNKEFISKAHRIRKVMGGGMRQAGFLAAAAAYALDNHVERLKEDHRRAKEIGKILQNVNYIEEVLPVDTNIIIFHLKKNLVVEDFLKKLEQQNIKAVSISPQTVRFVTHLDFDDRMLEKVVEVLKKM